MTESISLTEYLSQTECKERILIVSDISRGNTLIRMYEKGTGTVIRNVSCQTIDWVANQLYIFEQAGKGFNTEYELIDEQASLMLFRSVLFDIIDSLNYYNDKEALMSVTTSKEIFDKVNLMRSNECTLTEADNTRISDLRTLVDAFENKLQFEKKHDKIARCKYVLNGIRSGSVPNKYSFGSNTELSYLIEETALYESIQHELLTKISAKEVFYFKEAINKDIVLDQLRAKKDNISFFKGFGSFSEANYVAYDILNKKHNYGDVLVLYNFAAQLPAISSALLGNGIDMNVVSNYPATENNVISLARSIIAWAQNNYSEKSLEKILGNPVIYVPGEYQFRKKTENTDPSSENTDSDEVTESNTDKSNLSDSEKETIKKTNLLFGNNYYKYILNADRMNDKFILGWGYNRNLDFIKHEENYTKTNKASKDDRIKSSCSPMELIEMHKQMLAIFEGIHGSNRTRFAPSEIFERLYYFVKSYSRPIFVKNPETNKYKKLDDSHANGLGLLKNLSYAMRCDNRELEEKDALIFADEILSSVSISDNSRTNAVTVRALNDWIPLDRPNVYIIGLSLSEMQISSSQSPVIRDDEMEKYLKGKKCFAPTVINRIERKNLFIFQTLATFEDGTLSFGYSFWNTEKKAEANPSSLYSSAHDYIKGHDDTITGFEYGNPEGSQLVTKEAVNEKDNKIIEKFEKIKLSSTPLEGLLKCPKSFAFSKTMYIPKNEFNEPDPKHWLSPLSKGSFFHYILEDYSNGEMHTLTNELTEEEIQKIHVIAEAIKNEKMLNEVPYVDINIVESETEDLVDKEVIPYINKLREDMRINKWKIYKPEIGFDPFKLTYKTYDNSKEVTIDINSGFIDCVDYRLSEDEKTVYLRIRDYKTGNYDKKMKALEKGELIQFLVYSKAIQSPKLMDSIKHGINALEDGRTEGWSFVFETFRYDFPTDHKEKEIPTDIMEGKNITRLRAVLTIMKTTNSYPDVLEFYESLVKEPIKLEEKYKNEDPGLTILAKDLARFTRDRKQLIGPCKHCSYKDLCINRKAGRIKDDN